MKVYIILLFYILSATPGFTADKISAAPGLILANVYHADINLQDYWVSEKLDGVRAYWNGRHLVSRQGNIFSAPEWFIKPLPDIALDGELWLGRGTFEQLSGRVRQQLPSDNDWRGVKYMVFDLPKSAQTFDERLKQIDKIITQIDSPHIRMVKQFRVASEEHLQRLLDETVQQGGEGLMLHRGASLYNGRRSDDLLKLKKYLDAEAVVVRHLPGQGKYQGMLGSLEVVTEDNRRFKIGSGFSDEQRKNPPAIGTVITYKYFGLTKNGIPRFASFLRVFKRH